MSMHHPQAAEEARIRELRKKAEEEREAQLIRLQMQQQFERDKKIQQEKAEHEKELKKRARVDEQMRAKKAEMIANTQDIRAAEERDWAKDCWEGGQGWVL